MRSRHARSRGVGPGVDDDDVAAAVVGDERIALPDVAGDERPPGRRPGDGRRRSPTPRGEHEDRDGHRGRCRLRCHTQGDIERTARVRTASSTAAAAESPQSRRPKGSPAHRRATPAIAWPGSAAPQESHRHRAQTAETSATTTPTIGRRGDEGAASRLATTATTETGPGGGRRAGRTPPAPRAGIGDHRAEPAQPAGQAGAPIGATPGRHEHEQPQGRRPPTGRSRRTGPATGPRRAARRPRRRARGRRPAAARSRGPAVPRAHDRGADDAGLGAGEDDERRAARAAATSGPPSPPDPERGRRPR